MQGDVLGCTQEDCMVTAQLPTICYTLSSTCIAHLLEYPWHFYMYLLQPIAFIIFLSASITASVRPGPIPTRPPRPVTAWVPRLNPTDMPPVAPARTTRICLSMALFAVVHAVLAAKALAPAADVGMENAVFAHFSTSFTLVNTILFRTPC